MSFDTTGEAPPPLSHPAYALLLYVRRHITITLEHTVVGMRFAPDLAADCLRTLHDRHLIERLVDTDVFVLTNLGRGYTP